LINLIGNAIKFTPSGRVDVAVRWQEDILDLSVTDTGPGMDAASVSRLFEPYGTGAQGGARREGSTGLGLSIARRLARLMGGDLSVASWPGQGSRFRLQIPAVAGSSASAEVLATARPAFKVMNQRVLLAEDDEDIRALLLRDLEALGYTVHAVEDGSRAVEAAQGGRYDAILMDLEMPVMSGLEAVQILRRKGIALPLLGLTAHTQREKHTAALEFGFDAVLSKPVPTEILAAELDRHLHREVHQSSSSTPQPLGEQA